MSEKNRSRHGNGGIIAHYCAIPPSQPPFIAYNIVQYIFPTTPFIIAVKYWQYLVRANPLSSDMDMIIEGGGGEGAGQSVNLEPGWERERDEDERVEVGRG